MIFPSVWDIVEKFKQRCEDKGWKAFEYEDLIDAKGKYHHLIGIHHLYPNTFKKVAKNTYSAIREGNSYRKVDLSYTAWILQESVPKDVLKVLLENPDLLSRVALYDISPAYKGLSKCLKLNETESPVFQEFEKFLSEFKIELKPIHKTAR